MRIHEQMSITGELEITDSKTMKVIAQKLTLTAERTTSLQGRVYARGRKIECLFPASTDLSTGHGKGPWAPGGYSGTWLKRNATEIKRLEKVKVVKTQQVKPKSRILIKRNTKPVIHVFVEEELKMQVVQAAKDRGVKTGQVVIEALEMWLKKSLSKRH